MIWFEKYGFKENPFDIRKLSSELEGEKEQIEKLTSAIEEGSISQLFGEVGTGKTSILKVLKANLNKNFKTVYINCELLSGQQGIDFEKAFVKKPLIKFLQKPVVLFLDEIHSLPSYLIDNIKGLWDSKEIIKSIVVAQVNEDLSKNCSEPFISRISLKIETSKPTIEENIKIIKDRTNGNEIFSNDLLNVIIDDCQRNPRKILLACSDVCKKMDGKAPIDLEDYKKVRTEIQREEEEIKEEPKETKKILLSPTQKKIAELLRSGGKTLDELSTAMDMQSGSMGTQLQRMKKKRALIITKEEDKPTIYKLDEAYRLSTIQDGVRADE